MKKILSIFPVALFVIALMAWGNETAAQQQGGRDRANKEVNQAKQKGKEKAKEADEALQKEQERAREAVKEEEERAREAIKDEEERAREAMKDEEERVREAAQKEEERIRDMEGGRKDKARDKGKGNAYGRNKGGLEGRDFGQARAEEARMKHQERRSELDRKVEDGEQKMVQARERIRVAREDLEKEKASKRIPEDVYQQKKEKIDNAEKAVTELEEKIQKGRKLPGEI